MQLWHLEAIRNNNKSIVQNCNYNNRKRLLDVINTKITELRIISMERVAEQLDRIIEDTIDVWLIEEIDNKLPRKGIEIKNCWLCVKWRYYFNIWTVYLVINTISASQVIDSLIEAKKKGKEFSVILITDKSKFSEENLIKLVENELKVKYGLINSINYFMKVTV